MTAHIRGLLLPPLWDIIAEYFHDVELSMMSSLAIMPAGKYHKSSEEIPMPTELTTIYEDTGGISDEVRPISDKIKSMSSELTFIYEAALHLCTNVIEWKHPLYAQWASWESFSSENVHRVLALDTGAVISDNVEILEWILKTRPNNWSLKLVSLGFKYQKNNSLKWLWSKIMDRDQFEIMAVRFDNFELLRWHRQLVGKSMDSDTAASLLSDAVKYGSPPMLDWLLAAYGGSFGRDNPIPNRFWYAHAAESGKSANLEWLHKNGLAREGSSLMFARSIDAIRWLRKQGDQWDRDGAELREYARHGGIDLLEYAAADGCPWSPDVYKIAARGDRLEVLQWGVARGYPPDTVDLLDFLNTRSHIPCPRIRNWLKTLQLTLRT